MVSVCPCVLLRAPISQKYRTFTSAYSFFSVVIGRVTSGPRAKTLCLMFESSGPAVPPPGRGSAFPMLSAVTFHWAQ